MSYQWEIADHRLKASPYSIESVGVFGHSAVDAVDLLGEIREVKFRFGLDQLVKPVGNHPVFYLHCPDGADARGMIVGGFDVDGYEIVYFAA